MESGLLRICTAGSVDDGKSTLIGRLLHDSQSVYEDQVASVAKASKNRNAGPIDFSLFTDGLRAEREQGITIDVAYRYFATARRKFILADTPGHEQYTRNMATGASTADVAILLIDARNGVRTQSKRHARDRAAARHHGLRARHQQDGPRRLRSRGLREDPGRLQRVPHRRVGARHPDERARRRQRHHAQRAHAVLRRSSAARVSRDGAGASQPDGCSVPFPGPDGAAAGPGVPRLRGADRLGQHQSRRSRHGLAVWPQRPRQAHRHLRRRSGPRFRADVGHAHTGRRDRYQPRRRADGRTGVRRAAVRSGTGVDGRDGRWIPAVCICSSTARGR